MAKPPSSSRVGLALGSGGARGFAHLVILEAFDELGVRPAMIAGSSMGALLGAAYAGGAPAAEIKALVEEIYGSPDGRLLGFIVRREFFKYADLIDPTLDSSGLIRGEKFVNFLLGRIAATTFADLEIPFVAVATDLWRRKAKAFDRGPLAPALKASMAAPVIFTPETIDGVVYVDGALSNPVPWDLVAAACDVTVAVNVMEVDPPPMTVKIDFATVLSEQMDSLTQALVDERRRHLPPDIYVAPHLRDITAFDFFKVKQIYAQALPLKEKFKRDLDQLLSAVS